MKFWLPIVLAAMFGSFSAVAQHDVFLKIPGIPGESRVQGHEGEIEIVSWSWGVTNGGLARPRWADLNIEKFVDKASVRFMESVASRSFITNVLLTFHTGPSRLKYYSIKLDDVRIAGVLSHGNSGVLRATEQVRIAFSRMEVTYWVIDQTGTIAERIDSDWDVVSNSGGSSGTTPIRATLIYAAGSPTGQLKWNAVPGKTYEVLLSTTPAGPFNIFGTYNSGTADMTVNVPFDGPKAFFRIRQP